MSTYREVGHLQVKSRRVLTRNQIDQNLDLGLPSLWSCEKIHFYCLTLRICDMLFGQPNLIGIPAAAAKSLQLCPTLCDPIDDSPPGSPHPWDSPGKNIGVDCHFLLQCMKVKSESEVAQSCPTLCDPMDYILPGSSVHGIFQARVLEWVAISFSRGSSRRRDWTRVFRIAGRRFTNWATYLLVIYLILEMVL